MKYKIGDKVRNKKTGRTDIVKGVPGTKEYDKEDFICAEEGIQLKDAIWDFQRNWELLEASKGRKTLTNKKDMATDTAIERKLIVHCPTQELWDKVVEKAESEGGKRLGYFNYWSENKEASVIFIHGGAYLYLTYSHLAWAKAHKNEYLDYEFIEATEYLNIDAGEPIQEFRVGDRVRCIKGICKGITGTISKIDDDAIYCNDWSDGEYGNLSKENLELIELEPIRTLPEFPPLHIVDDGPVRMWADEEGYDSLLLSYTPGAIIPKIELSTKKPKTTMQQLNTMMKRLLDAPTKKLVKAGMLNGDLEFTQKGGDVLNGIFLDKFKDELVKEADAIIKEEKENCR